MQFHIVILFRFLCNKRCFKDIFRVLDEKTTNTPNDRDPQFDIVASDDLDLREGYIGLRRMLRDVTDPNHVDS